MVRPCACLLVRVRSSLSLCELRKVITSGSNVFLVTCRDFSETLLHLSPQDLYDSVDSGARVRTCTPLLPSRSHRRCWAA